jgi:hypothetical protein
MGGPAYGMHMGEARIRCKRGLVANPGSQIGCNPRL